MMTNRHYYVAHQCQLCDDTDGCRLPRLLEQLELKKNSSFIFELDLLKIGYFLISMLIFMPVYYSEK